MENDRQPLTGSSPGERENAPLLIDIHTPSASTNATKPDCNAAPAVSSAPPVPTRRAYFDTTPSPQFAPSASSNAIPSQAYPRHARTTSASSSRRGSLVPPTPHDDVNVGAAAGFFSDFLASTQGGSRDPNWRSSTGSLESGGRSPRRKTVDYGKGGSPHASSPNGPGWRLSEETIRQSSGFGGSSWSNDATGHHRHISAPETVLMKGGDEDRETARRRATKQLTDDSGTDKPHAPPADDSRLSQSPTDMTLGGDLSGRDMTGGTTGYDASRARRLGNMRTFDHTPDLASEDDDVCVPADPGASLNYEAIERYLGGGRAPSYVEGSEVGKGTTDGGGEDIVGLTRRMGGTKKSFEAPSTAPSRLPSRIIFYSQMTGSLGADRFEDLDFEQFPETTGEILKSGPFWIDVTDPTHSEMVMFSRFFGIHPLTTEDIQTQDTREKCEMFVNYYFICIRTFDQNQYSMSYMQPINVYMVVFKECILSFHFRPTEHSANVLRRISQLESYGLKITPDWINYALIDDITDAFMPLLRFIELEVDSIDDLVLILKESEQSDMLRRIGHARKKVMGLLRLLTTKADVLKMVIKRSGERGGIETTLYLGDIQDHVITMVQNLSHYEKTLARSHSNYLAQISIEITQASNRTNDVVMRMTALASILVPLNVITGLFGMNVPVPGGETTTLWWFFGIVAGMIVISVTVFVWVKRNKLF
ncbi:CorA metal ion transporter [Rhizophlyctis rosea]|uniref:CorA metal ion transporter n=1 Tax=Rhizophlyctis rosea TaxID=64517 RepID=A0AAD5SES3_9FUNG|nr:CorA metal ion transporter [Rhizophlyctis rosea]